MLMHRERCEILPVLCNSTSNVIVAPLHLHTLLIEHLCDSLTYSPSVSCFASEHVRVCVDGASFIIFDANFSTYSVYIARRVCDGKFRSSEAIEQKHICIIINEKESVTTVS